MGRLSLDVALFYGSLGISLAAVAQFLWLMRRTRGPGDDVLGDPRAVATRSPEPEAGGEQQQGREGPPPTHYPKKTSASR